MNKYVLKSGRYRRLELIGQRTEEPCGYIRLWESGRIRGEFYFKFRGFEPWGIDLEKDTDYEIEISGLEISLSYLCGQDQILDEGVRFLVFGEDGLVCWDDKEMELVYAQEFRNRFHFAPFKNWMNDPNGLCYFKGYYHLFYQYNPNGFQWGNMHWGHAASKDLMHWKHLPVAAYPQIELMDNEEFRGGAFSGSAVVDGDEMYLFYTRHFGRVDRIWQRQWQVTCKTKDGIHFTKEEIAVWGTPQGVFYDFRDPKVEKIDGVWTMVLGGTVNHVPAVLRYTSEDLKQWNYKGVLLEEKNPIYGISECPDLFFLDGKYVLTVGFIYSKQESRGQRRDTKYYIGRIEDGKLLVESEGIYDYGKDFYAVQSFETEGRRIGIGWNCGLESVWEEGSSNGTMSIPRELKIKDGKIIMCPVREFRSLLGSKYMCEIGEHGFEAEVPEEYALDIKSESGMHVFTVLACNGEKKASLKIEGCKVILNTGDDRDICVLETEEDVIRAELFVDRSLIEVFINDGRYTCSRRYFISEKQRKITGSFSGNTSGITVAVHPVNNIWRAEGGEK